MLGSDHINKSYQTLSPIIFYSNLLFSKFKYQFKKQLFIIDLFLGFRITMIVVPRNILLSFLTLKK